MPLKRRYAFCNDFKIRWRQNDGSRTFANAIGKNLCQTWRNWQKPVLPYISLCTDPTTGGTTASYAMLGDINISEPGALIGFAGPSVVKDTTGKELPEGFQSSEFLKEHGFLDFISHRRDLKKKINLYIDLIQNNPIRSAS